MAVTRIDHTGCSSYGWQARAYVPGERRRLTAYFADEAHGGVRAAKRKAEHALIGLQRRAQRLGRKAA